MKEVAELQPRDNLAELRHLFIHGKVELKIDGAKARRLCRRDPRINQGHVESYDFSSQFGRLNWWGLLGEVLILGALIAFYFFLWFWGGGALCLGIYVFFEAQERAKGLVILALLEDESLFDDLRASGALKLKEREAGVLVRLPHFAFDVFPLEPASRPSTAVTAASN